MKEDVPFVAIVDDILDNVRVLHHCLQADGYNFGIAHSGEELFLLLASRIPTVILLDIMLPDIDGFHILQKLHKDPAYKEIPIIFVSARTDSVDIIKGLELGGVDYITKPFNEAEVRARVKTHIRLKQALDNEKALNKRLKEALNRVKTLEGIIPICAHCKSIRNDEGFWTQVESYLSKHTDALFSHSLCPSCAKNLYPEASEECLLNLNNETSQPDV